LPLIFWKKLLGHWTVEKLKEEEALILELHVLSSMKLPVDRNMPRQEKPPHLGGAATLLKKLIGKRRKDPTRLSVTPDGSRIAREILNTNCQLFWIRVDTQDSCKRLVPPKAVD